MLSFYLSLIKEESDQTIFADLYNKYEKQMWFVANKILSNGPSAEDAVHNAFLRIIHNIKTLRTLNEEAKRKYVLTASKNAALDMIRKESKFNTVNIDVLYDLKDDKASDELENLGNETMVILTLKKLPDKYRDVMYLHFVLDMTEKEIAVFLNRKINTVRQQIARGRKMFIELYDEEMSKT